MSRAVVSDQLGDLSLYTLRDHHPGQPAPGEVQIRVHAAGVSFVDILNARGEYQRKALTPFIPGSELAGVIIAVGDGVPATLALGQRVMATCWGGAFAEVTNVPAARIQSVPPGMSFECAAVYSVSALTAWHGLVDRARLQQGESVLVLGAAGATGHAAVQMARYLGAQVIASASSAAKQELARRAGAHATVTTGAASWRNDVLSANQGQPIDVIFDPVGGAATERAFRTLGWNGRHLIVGFPAGIAALKTNLPLLKSASLVGVNLHQLQQFDPERARQHQAQLLKLAAEGHFHPTLDRVYPLHAFRSAMERVAAGDTCGRIVIDLS